jgi:hypothetical protein
MPRLLTDQVSKAHADAIWQAWQIAQRYHAAPLAYVEIIEKLTWPDGLLAICSPSQIYFYKPVWGHAIAEIDWEEERRGGVAPYGVVIEAFEGATATSDNPTK